MAQFASRYASTPPKEPVLEKLDRATALGLRAYGRYSDKGIVVYNLFDYSNRENSILFIMDVDEQQQRIVVKDKRNNVIMTAREGLSKMERQMKVSWAEGINTGEGFGTVTGSSLCTMVYEDCIIKTIRNGLRRLYYSPPLYKALTCELTCSAVIGFMNKGFYNVSQKALIAMLLLKLCYAEYNTHTSPVPVELLSNLPPDRQVKPTLDVLANWDNKVFRASCISYDQSLYIDVLSGRTQQISFVCKRIQGSNKTVFLLPNGTEVFYIMYDDQKDHSYVYKHDDNLVGYIEHEVHALYLKDGPRLTAAAIEVKTGWSMFCMLTGVKGQALADVIWHPRPQACSLVQLNMTDAVAAPLKALIVACTLRICCGHCKFDREILPRMDYQFRRRG